MKRSVNFNGMKKWRGANANDLLATFRFLGMSDEEIKAKLLEMKASNTASTPTGGSLAASQADTQPEDVPAKPADTNPPTSG